jgi:hypothetical protein
MVKFSFSLNKSKLAVVAVLFVCVFLSSFHPVTVTAYPNDSPILHSHFGKTNEAADQENICTWFCHSCSGFCALYISKTNNNNYHTIRIDTAFSLLGNFITKENKNDIFKPPKN